MESIKRFLTILLCVVTFPSFAEVTTQGCKVSGNTLKETLEYSLRVVVTKNGSKIQSVPCNSAFRAEFFTTPYSLAQRTTDELFGKDQEGLDITEQTVNYYAYLPRTIIVLPVMTQEEAKQFEEANTGWTGKTLTVPVSVEGVFSGAPRLISAHKAYKRLQIAIRNNAVVQFEVYISLPDRMFSQKEDLTNAIYNMVEYVRINTVGGFSVID